MKNNGKNSIDSSIQVNSDEDSVYVNYHEENVDVMEVVTWEANEEFDVGLSPFKDVQKNCEEIDLVDDIETHVIDDTTGYTSNNEIQNDENPVIDQAEQGLSISPGGTNWYTPVVEEVIKPIIGSVYLSLDVAESIYQKYAETAGFEVRRSTQKINPDGVIQNKYFVCSRFGLPLKKSFDSMVCRKHQREVRNSNIKRTGCIASVKFRLMKGTTTYECYGFEEDHNHSLLRHKDMDLTRKGRQMKFSDQRFVHDAGISNMGATRAHKLHTSLRGGYEYGGPTVVDYQNYKRDCDNFFGRGDAKVLVDLMTKKRDADHNFFFEYNCVGSKLHTIFWVEVARFNYSEFGDVISFDATFRTNSQLERHACEIYTCSVFFKVQTEIHRTAWTCSIKSVNLNEEVETYLIEHLDKRDEKIAEYKVVRNLKESTVVCNCNHVGRHGYLCRRVQSFAKHRRQRICDVGEDQRRIINDTYEIVNDVLDILRDDKEKLESFVATLKEMRDDVAKDRTYEPSMKRKERGIEQILGFTRPDNIEIHPAIGIKTKVVVRRKD
ncbi:FAR1 DNA binding domain-containing protein [Cynara cardunculus var. scolymus]|uniref:FAR1 DNA binding domain-containing protein n=1 Tax=Cynara cardunculus var. scolymus TaxID=59895 RepID=A0A118K0J9_CYNCS|nr:FAR1 DNA binding domain-containing protein [Cynara cardunculus var. scolymus]